MVTLGTCQKTSTKDQPQGRMDGQTDRRTGWISIQSAFISTFSLLKAKLWPGAATLTCGQWFLLFHEPSHQKQHWPLLPFLVTQKEQNSPTLCVFFSPLTFNLNSSQKATKLCWENKEKTVKMPIDRKKEVKECDIGLHRDTFKNRFLFSVDSEFETHRTCVFVLWPQFNWWRGDRRSEATDVWLLTRVYHCDTQLFQIGALTVDCQWIFTTPAHYRLNQVRVWLNRIFFYKCISNGRGMCLFGCLATVCFCLFFSSGFLWWLENSFQVPG